ncbi:Uncharacterised protein [Mycobacteroides abscessus subsp. abscessus]|nr:Uncharacterised protein [Mycobacteroides abscessus subsp. abscessus]
MLGQIGYREGQQAARVVADPDVVALHIGLFAWQLQTFVRDLDVRVGGVGNPLLDCRKLLWRLVTGGQEVDAGVVGEEELAGMKSRGGGKGATGGTAGVVREGGSITGVVGDAVVPPGYSADHRKYQCAFNF